MSSLDNFKEKDFLEQVQILTRIGEEKDIAYLPQLFFLYDLLRGDQTIDAMVEHTLRDILMEHEEEAIKILHSQKKREVELGLQVVKRKKFSSAASALIELIDKNPDMEIVSSAFVAMSEIRAPEFLEVFRQYAQHPDEIVSGVSIGMIGYYQDITSLTLLTDMVNQGEMTGEFQVCRLKTAQAIESLGAIDHPDATAYLVSKIHHRNPTARRIIHDCLVKRGSGVLDFIPSRMPMFTEDEKILAINLISRIGDRKGGEILLRALDDGLISTENTKAALYDALGNIQFLKGLVCLIDALNESEAQTLMTVVLSLDRQVSEVVVRKIVGIMDEDSRKGDRILHTIAAGGATMLFKALYVQDQLRAPLIKMIKENPDPSQRHCFVQILESMASDQAKDDAREVAGLDKEEPCCRILVVDDQRSVRLFIKSVLMAIGYEVDQATDGKDALRVIEEGDADYRLILTDMNMPEMDGVEFVTRLKAMPVHGDIPVIMCTTETEASQKSLATAAGVIDYINKPIEKERLVDKVRHHAGFAAE